MKSLGDRVREFRQHPLRNWSTGELARRVGTSRQNIENLEAGSVQLPKYLVELADVMQADIDDLLGRARRGGLTVAEPAASYGPTLDECLTRIGAALAAAPDETRPALADNLAGWARDRGADHYREVLLLLLTRPASKRHAIRAQ